MSKKTKFDMYLDVWLKNLNYTVTHHCDKRRFHGVIMHGYKYVKNFSTSYLEDKIQNCNHYVDDDSMEKLMRKVDIIISFLKDEFPKPISRSVHDTEIEYYRKNADH